MVELSSIKITWDHEDRPVIDVTYADKVGSAGTDATPDEWLEAFAGKLGDKSAKYLRKLIDTNETSGPVSLAELAVELGVEKREVEGWNRNLGRTIKPVVREHGFLRPEQDDGTAQLFDFHWEKDESLWKYSVPQKFRALLIKELDTSS